MDRIDTMRAFVTVVSEGSFTRAAERLELSPQLVSKYVSRLERHLGVRLLNRSTRRVSLTEAGGRYHQRALQLLADLDAMESELSEIQTQAQGTLRISAPVSFATHHLPALLSAFQRAHPAVSIDLQVNDRKVDIVEEGFDIALRIGRLKSSSLIARRITSIRVLLCASPAYLERHGRPERLEQLAGHRYLRYSYIDSQADTPFHRWLSTARGSAAGGNTEGALVCNNGDVLVQAAIEGSGIALQPTFICGPHIAAGQLEVVLPEQEPPPLGLYAVYAHRQLLAAKVRCFVDFMADYFGDPPYWDQF